MALRRPRVKCCKEPAPPGSVNAATGLSAAHAKRRSDGVSHDPCLAKQFRALGIVMKIAAVHDSVFWFSWAEQQGPHRSEAKAGRIELEPPCLVPDPIRLGHRLAFPAAGVH